MVGHIPLEDVILVRVQVWQLASFWYTFHMLTLYYVVSEDGYIADVNGSEDFIPDSFWSHTLETLKKYDCIMIGRHTYDVIQNYEEEMVTSFEALHVRKVVVTKNKNFKPKEGYEVVVSPEEMLQEDINVVVTSGPTLNNYLLNKKLVDRVLYHEVPISIGGGIKPYDKIIDLSIEVVKLN